MKRTLRMSHLREKQVQHVSVDVPLLVRGQALDVLRVPVGSSRDSGRSRHPSTGSPTCSRRRCRHLNTEIREDPDHPRARTAMLHQQSVCGCLREQPSLRSDKSEQHNPMSDRNKLMSHSTSCFLVTKKRIDASRWFVTMARMITPANRSFVARPVRFYA